MNKKAFLLLEVVLTIAILSLGLVFIVRSISMSMRVAKVSFNYSKAINLASEKMFDLELESQTDGIENIQDKGVFAQDERFNWKYSIEKIENEDFGKLILDISWKEGKRESGFNIATYVNLTE